MKTFTGVGCIVSASHADLESGEIHGHTYHVEAWFEFALQSDALLWRDALQSVCMAYDHATLPDNLARAEWLAAEILKRLPAAVAVEIRRPGEMLHARVER